MGESRFRRALHRFAASDSERESEELIERAHREGAEPVSRCQDRSRVCVSGTVRSVRLDTRGGSPVLEVELFDGTGVLTLVFLGRRGVAGIDAGRSLTAHGRITMPEGRRTMFNPSYELLPADAGAR